MLKKYSKNFFNLPSQSFEDRGTTMSTGYRHGLTFLAESFCGLAVYKLCKEESLLRRPMKVHGL